MQAAGAAEGPALPSLAAALPRLLARRTSWLMLAALLHIGALLGWLLLWPEAAEAPPDVEIIPVTLVTDETPPEREISREILHFRVPTHPRVNETVRVARRVQALAPPPPDAVLAEQGAAGGYSIAPLEAASAGTTAFGGLGGGVAFTGVGSGNAEGPTGTFEEYVGGIRQIGLDVVFVIDATGSMGWLIADVKARVHSLAAWIRELVPVTRFGVVAYRDRDAPDFVVKVQRLTLSTARISRFLDTLEARGGGDIPEDVHAGLEAAIGKAGFRRDAKRVIILLGDAPPHRERLPETLAMVRDFHARGGSVTLVDVSFDANPAIAAARLGRRIDELQTLQERGPYREFVQLAEAGGGDAGTLQGDTVVVRQLAVLIFGRRWAEAVNPLLGDL